MLAAPAPRAELCTIDAVPAATLLLPYFEVAYEKKNGEDWVVSINNASPAPVIAHVVLWTDLSIPTFDFDVLLTGFDTQTFSLKKLFRDGRVPAKPPFSGFESLRDLRNAHSGKSIRGNCYASSGGRVARGYLTIDSVASAGRLLNPSDGDYFDKVATNENVLWGQYYVTKGSFLQTENLVHVEAGSNGNSGYTFYGRYTDFTGTDGREPLADQWGARYFIDGRNKTYLIVWRDSGAEQEPFTCNGLEGGWYPLGQTEIIAYDEQENLVELTFDADHPPFPAETQRVRVGSSKLPVPFDSGWLFMNLATEAGLQSYMIVQQDSKKRSGHHMAHPLIPGENPTDSSACGAAPTIINRPSP
jgi:hypothetical protein